MPTIPGGRDLLHSEIPSQKKKKKQNWRIAYWRDMGSFYCIPGRQKPFDLSPKIFTYVYFSFAKPTDSTVLLSVTEGRNDRIHFSLLR